MDERINKLIELRTNFSEIRHIMERVVTDEPNLLDELELDYSDLHAKINEDIEYLKNEGIFLINYNPHETLSEFYASTRGKFGTYNERRHYVSDLYLKTDEKIRGILEDIDDATEYKSFIRVQYIEKITVYDNYYYDLINLINDCYSLKLYPVIPSLIRKILENMVIDILRKKYGMTDITKFYNPHEGRFLNFRTLLDNLKENLSDFTGTSLDNNVINKIDDFRVQGNSYSHSLELDYNNILPKLDNQRDELNDLIKKLNRIHDII